MQGVTEFKEALESKSLTALTTALRDIADQLAYQLKPPYTEILDFRAREQSGRFSVHFRAKLYLHYSLASQVGGLLFIIQFGGDALSDTPTPPSDELFYAGMVESFRVHAYGSKWIGPTITVSQEVAKNLEVPSKVLADIDVDRFVQQLQRM
ncbi:MAG: hypothetical protein ABSA50_08585 [Candidatus Bathyarchaeia archaeon]|jgi:hypothetical protein